MDRRNDHDGAREPPVRAIAHTDGGVVVTLAGELDLHAAPALREALLTCTEANPARLVIDLADVEFVDSTVLGVLVEARSRVPNRGAFVLVAPGLETRRALQISGLDRHFALHESVAAALAARL